MYFQMSWRDARARAAVLNATVAAADPAYNGGAGCKYPCTSMYAWTPGSRCCDGVFLPTLGEGERRGALEVQGRTLCPSQRHAGTRRASPIRHPSPAIP